MKKIQIHKVIFTVFLFAIGFTMLTPLLWMISTSFKPETKYFSFLSNGFRNTVSDLPTIKKCGGSAYNFWNVLPE